LQQKEIKEKEGDKRKRRAIKRKRFMLNKKEVSLLD